MSPKDIKIYQMAAGRLPFVEEPSGLTDDRTKQRIQARIARVRLGTFGNTRFVGGGVWERKIDTGPASESISGNFGTALLFFSAEATKAGKLMTSKKQSSSGKAIKRKHSTSCADYDKHLFEDLKDPDYAAGYLTACLEEGSNVFLLGIRQVTKALGGVKALARTTKLNRENLYNMLSKDGNPRLSSLTAILDTLGLEVKLQPKRRKRKAA